MTKDVLNSSKTKTEFIKSIHTWLMNTLEARGYEKYKDNFKIDGSSIICHLPPDFFTFYEIPANTCIEMKFISKK